MSLPTELYEILEMRLGVRVKHAVSVGGGMVAKAAKVVTDDGPVFVKWKLADAGELGGASAEPGRPAMFESEADGLSRLRAIGGLRVPEVRAFADTSDGVAVPFLALEWLEPRESANPRVFTENFAEGLARLHRESHSESGRFGLERDNFLGRRLQRNDWTAHWGEFYRDCRVRPMIALARENGRLGARRERGLEALAERIPDLLPAEEPACLVHGDLWSGNFLELGDQAALVDPAVYYADREVELAYVQLFGGFPHGFLEAYHHRYPVDRGYTERRPLLQLYPLLVHLISFGEAYGPQVDAVCAYYGQ